MTRNVNIFKYCKFCHNKFYKKESTSKKDWTKALYCSQKCHYADHRDIKICPICGKTFTDFSCKHRTYCSQLCADRSRPDRGGKIINKCIVCGKIFTPNRRGASGRSARFCSHGCSEKYHTGGHHWNWLGGKSFEPYSTEFTEELRRAIRDRDNHTCQGCGKKDGVLNRKLHIHHIDYNKKNNNPNNLISLCCSCHAKTNFDREDWTNYFKKKL